MAQGGKDSAQLGEIRFLCSSRSTVSFKKHLRRMTSMSSNKRFCIINCENSSAWSPYTFSDMFEQGLRGENDVWVNCELAKGDSLPDDILQFDGIVITGSRFNCRDRDNLTWFDPLCEVIRAASATGSPKVYGGCFGCQIIAFALGGKVDYNPDGKFILRAEDIKFNPQHSPSLLFEDFPEKWISDGANVIVSHGDCVIEAPKNAKLLASSASCKHEVYLCGSNDNILACQGHPEFEYEYAVRDRIWKSVVEVAHRLAEEDIELSLNSFELFDGSDSKKMLQLISQFLHSDK